MRPHLTRDDDPGSEVQVFFDDRVLVSGQPLTETLREKVQRSALLLVLMSLLYPEARASDELEWFFQQTRSDGRGQEHCTVLCIQPLAEDAWPKFLRDERDKPVLYHDFVDPLTELPIGLTNHRQPNSRRRCSNFSLKLRESSRRSASTSMHAPDVGPRNEWPPADRPVIYFEADPDEEALWANLKGELKDLAIVRPTNLLRASGELASA